MDAGSIQSWPVTVHPIRRISMRNAILLVPLALVACGGSGSSSASSVVTLQPGGANPAAISVLGGAQMEFINADAIDHQIASSDCPELNSPRLAAVAESRSTSSFLATLGAQPKICTFADGLHPSSTTFQGTVTVQQSPGRSGY